MDIVRIIERRFGRLLGRDVSGRADVAKDAPAAGRVCEYGHAIFEGNHLCNYGHRPA